MAHRVGCPCSVCYVRAVEAAADVAPIPKGPARCMKRGRDGDPCTLLRWHHGRHKYDGGNVGPAPSRADRIAELLESAQAVPRIRRATAPVEPRNHGD